MNNIQKKNHLRTNIVIVIGMVIIVISLIWLGYRMINKSIAIQVDDKIIQDESSEQTEPASNVLDSSEQTSDNPQDTTSATDN